MSESPGRYQRSFSGMVGALLALLVFIAGFVAFRAVNRDEPADPVKAVDYLTPYQYARDAADFTVLAPPTLPSGWKATSVEFVDGGDQAWHVGFLTDDDEYVGLEQSGRPATEMVHDFVDKEATPGGEVSIDGATWSSWTDDGGDVALVRAEGGATTLVVATTSQDRLVAFVKTLR